MTTLGLVLDIVGALWIVKSLLWLREREISEAAHVQTGWDAAPGPRAALMQLLRSSRRDARIGGGLLASGFALQIIALWIR